VKPPYLRVLALLVMKLLLVSLGVEIETNDALYYYELFCISTSFMPGFYPIHKFMLPLAKLGTNLL